MGGGSGEVSEEERRSEKKSGEGEGMKRGGSGEERSEKKSGEGEGREWEREEWGGRGDEEGREWGKERE